MELDKITEGYLIRKKLKAELENEGIPITTTIELLINNIGDISDLIVELNQILADGQMSYLYTNKGGSTNTVMHPALVTRKNNQDLLIKYMKEFNKLFDEIPKEERNLSADEIIQKRLKG
mgnify:CR=1 FL=1